MAIILTDETALAFWRRSGMTGSNLLRATPTRMTRIPAGAPSARDVRAACNDLAIGCDCLHVLVACDADRRHGTHAVEYHLLSKTLPNHSLYRIDNGLYATSPELTFVRMSRKTSLIAITRLGYEMAGTFARNESDMRGFSTCSPLMTTKSLGRFLNCPQALHGFNRSKQAARLMLDNAASPMEAELAMMLSLPNRLGGYGLPKPVLNYRLDTKGPLSKNLRRRTIVVDVAWPAKKLALEYDSDQFHTGAEKIAADSERRNDIELLGFDVQTITNKEISSAANMDKIAHTIARKLGLRTRREPDGFADRQASLRRTLIKLRGGNWGMSEY